MVMNFGTYDINIHMLNHYKRINSAKNVVNTKAKRKNSKNCNKTGSVASITSRYSTPIFSGGRRAESSQSNYQQKSLTKSDKHVRVNSAPTKNGKKSKSDSAVTLEKSSPKIIDELQCPDNTCTSLCTEDSNSLPLKTPVPTPRTIINKNHIESPSVPDFEYLQFSLRITEDIIRNDLYTNKEMQRVFNSHLEANRGRLNMKKMLEQIDLLCTELNIGKDSEKSDCKCPKDVSINTSRSNKKEPKTKELKNDIINKILSGEKMMTDDEIQKLNENELQDIVTKLLSSHEEQNKEEIIKKSDNIFCLNYADLLRKPELTVEEVLNVSLNEEMPQIIKHNLLSPEIQIDDYSDFSSFNFEKYINKDFPKMGVDVSVQTLTEESEAKEELDNKECCMYNMDKKEKSFDILLDEIVTESSNFESKDGYEEKDSAILLKKEELKHLEDVCQVFDNQNQNTSDSKFDLNISSFTYVEKAKCFPTFINSENIKLSPYITDVNFAPDISIKNKYNIIKHSVNCNKFRYPSFLCPNNIELEMEEHFNEQQIRGELLEYEKMNIFDLRNFDTCLIKLSFEKHNFIDLEQIYESDFEEEFSENSSLNSIKTSKSLENFTDTFNEIDFKIKKVDSASTISKFKKRLKKIENSCKDIFENNDSYIKIGKTRSDNAMSYKKCFGLNSKLLFTDKFKSKSLIRLV